MTEKRKGRKTCKTVTCWSLYGWLARLENNESEIRRLQAKVKKLKSNHKVPLVYPYDDDADQTTIFMITPTYARHTQKADLTRLLYTLLHVPNLHWIIVEDSPHKTDLITKFITVSFLKLFSMSNSVSEFLKYEE